MKWNPPLLPGGILELENLLFAVRKVDDSERDPLNLGVKPVQVAQLESALAKLWIMPDAGQELVDRGHA